MITRNGGRGLWLSGLLLGLAALACSDAKPVTAPEPDEDDEVSPPHAADSLLLTTQSGRPGRPYLFAELGDTLEAWVLVARVQDGDESPKAGEALRFEVVEGAAVLLDSADTTDAGGQAIVRVRVGDTPGPIVVRIEATRTGDQAQLRGDGVRADRFGPSYHDCGYLGLDSRIEAIPKTEGGYAPAVSPDGTRLAFEVYIETTREIYVLEMASGFRRRATLSADAGFPTWSPDGMWIAYSDLGHDSDTITIVPADGGPERRFPPLDGRIWWTRWSPSGEFILFSWLRPGHHWESWLQPVAGDEPQPLLAGVSPVGALDQPAWSPDGRRIGYVAGSSIRVLDLVTGRSEEILWDREGGVEDFAWDPVSGTVVYGSLRRSSRHLFLYRPAEDLWCSIPGTGERNVSTPAWLVPGHSLVISGRNEGRQLYRVDLDR